ncbi:MAG: hypothetical protein HRT61_24140, partial [Ekhidna sp.]|nr:hypothetical protein [Ekhidna sp.]
MCRLINAKSLALAEESILNFIVSGLFTCLSLFSSGQTPEVNYASPIDLTSFERPPVYTGDFYTTTAQETNPRFVQFSSDGTSMFILGTSSTVREYNLITPFSIASGVTVGESQPVGAFGGLFFNYEGDRMFIVDGAATDQVIAYNLSTNYTLSSAIQADTYDLSAQTTSPFGVRFNLEGTKMYVVGSGENSIFTYTMGTPYDISNASPAGAETLDVSGKVSNPRDLTFNADGSKLFVMNSTDDNIIQYAL